MDRNNIIEICNKIQYEGKRLPKIRSREFVDVLMNEAIIDFSVIGIENKGFIYSIDILSDKELALIIDTISTLCRQNRKSIIKIIAQKTNNIYMDYKNTK